MFERRFLPVVVVALVALLVLVTGLWAVDSNRQLTTEVDPSGQPRQIVHNW